MGHLEGVLRVMRGAPEKAVGEDGLPVPPYAVYNIGGGTPENLLDYVSTLQEELVRAGVLPADYEFEGHREWVILMNDHIPTTIINSSTTCSMIIAIILPVISLLTIEIVNKGIYTILYVICCTLSLCILNLKQSWRKSDAKL